MRKSQVQYEDSAVADAIARGVPVKKVGYFESTNARLGLSPADGFRVAKADEEILPRPVAEVYVITKGEGAVTVNGSKILKPLKVYADGVREYSQRITAQTPDGQRPGILSLKIEEGTEFKFKVTTIPTGGALL